MSNTTDAHDQLLGLSAVAGMTGLGWRTILALAETGGFPSPDATQPPRWRRSSIEAWRR